jgi:predicted nucleotidyltransferase
MYQNRNTKYRKKDVLDALGSKVAVRLLRFFIDNPRTDIGIQGLARSLDTSRTSILRKLGPIVEMGVVRASEGTRGRLYSLNTASPLAGSFFTIFNHERYMRVDPAVRAGLERLVAGIDKRRVRCLVLFGSQVHGNAARESDIDLCVVHKEGRWRETDTSELFERGFIRMRIEPHIYPERLFSSVPDMVALDAITSGISLLGDDYLFDRRVTVRSIDKTPLLDRLADARRNLESMGLLKGPSKEYFERLLEVLLGEMEALVNEGRIVPKASIRHKGHLEERIDVLEDALAQGGDEVWVS